MPHWQWPENNILYHVKPGKLNVIQYTGGKGGEFLCHWLNLDSTGQNLHTRFLPNNRFILPKFYRSSWQIDNNSSDQPMFYPCHPHLIDSKLKEYINNGLANLFVLNSDTRYFRYYFFLFLIKTLFSKNSNFTLKHAIKKIELLNPPYNDPTQLTQTLGRPWHYTYEIDHYINQDIIPPFREAMPEIIDNRIAMGALSADINHYTTRHYNKFHNINSIELYFGNTQQEYEKICAYGNLMPTQSVEHVKSYVRKNIDLVEKYSELSFETFLNTNNESIKYLLYNMLEKHHDEEYQNTP